MPKSKSKRRGGKTAGLGSARKETPLADFFALHPQFSYNPTRSATSEFYRLCDLNGWGKSDADRKDAHAEFQDALTKQFNSNYGTDENDISNWERLCVRLGIDPIPDTLSECRQAVKKTHVNLVDLVDAFDDQRDVTIFPSVLALSEYTKLHGKFFPRENAYAGNLLKFLLRQIMNPGQGRSGRSGRARGGGPRGGVGWS